VRWALSYYIDRGVVVDVGWSGASEPIELPMPTSPGLQPFADAVRPLLDKYPTNEFNPKKGDDLLTKNGFKKDSNGKWLDSTGKPLKFDIITTGSFVAVAPVVGELLKAALTRRCRCRPRSTTALAMVTTRRRSMRPFYSRGSLCARLTGTWISLELPAASQSDSPTDPDRQLRASA